MNLFDLPDNIAPQPTPRELKESIVKSDLIRIQRAGTQRVADHKAFFLAFWDNPQITPDEYLEILGPRALKFLMTAQESLRNAVELTKIGGLNLDEELPPHLREPRRQFIPGMDPALITAENPYGLTGYLTLAPPAEGYDAWGRLIPPPPVDPALMDPVVPLTPVLPGDPAPPADPAP